MQKRTRFLPTAFYTILSCFNEFPFFMKSLLSNFQSALLHSTRWIPNIKPQTATFLHTYANDFANTANPVSIPVFLFLNGQWRGGGGVEGSTVEGYMLSLTKKSHHQSPTQSLYFLTYYTATKNSFTLLEITIGQEKMHGRCVHSAFGRRWCPQRDNPIPCQKTQPAQ